MIRQEDDNDDGSLMSDSVRLFCSPFSMAGMPEMSGALSPTLTTLLYLPAKAGIATRERTTRLKANFRMDAFSSKSKPDAGAATLPLPINQSIDASWKSGPSWQEPSARAGYACFVSA